MVDFYGNVVNDKAILKWTSLNEQNMKEYEVEKSFDGINFSKVGIVTATNSINTVNYSFDDPEDIASFAYYRLKFISQSYNRNEYSKIIILYNKNALLKVSVINPFKSDLKINIFLPADGNVEVIVFNTFGKTITKEILHLNKGNSLSILDNVEHLPVGVYFLRTRFNNTVVLNKLFKVE